MTPPGNRPPTPDDLLAAARPLLDHLLDVLGRTPGGRAEAARFAREAADLADCYLWMLGPDGGAAAPRVWDDLAGAFELGAAAAELLEKWEFDRSPDAARAAPDVLAVAAEAQSTLLYAVADARMIQQD